MTCNQDGCKEPASYKFTWPGHDEKGICENHVKRLRGVASAMGLYVQIIPLEKND